MSRHLPAILLLLALFFTTNARATEREDPYDVVVYGGTSAGVTAAVQAARMGKTVVLVCPETHLGGLSSGGLGWTDTGRKEVIGGLSREFYHRVWRHYEDPDSWRWQQRGEYGDRGQGTKAIDGERRTMWIFEPHVAERVFEDMIREANVPVVRDQWLDREQGVERQGSRITAITTLEGRTFRGRMFLDATYEGDLMAAAGVSYHVGRESADTYGEQFGGVRKTVRHHKHHFAKPISPYVVPNDPSSGLLPRVHGEAPGEEGDGDHRVQAYCFRMCLTNVPENRVPFAKPDGYDPREYELLARTLEAGWDEVFGKFDPIPNGKTDTNNHGPFSTDNIGRNYDYPEADYARRREIVKEHEAYQQGLMYFLANDPRVPEELRLPMSQWGLAGDEFTENGNWSRQLYIREARRMVGCYVMTEHDCLGRRVTPESVGMGSYAMDSHHVQRYVDEDGHVRNEGDIGVGAPWPYQISYGSLVPKSGECDNLLVPVCVSSSHIAFGSVRMEPVFMILGQSAATAAVLAIEGDLAVQDVQYAKLRERLLADGQVLDLPPELEAKARGAGRVPVSTLVGVVLDDHQAEYVGDWGGSATVGGFVGAGYRHDGATDQLGKTARFETSLASGRWEVRLSYSASSNRAEEVAVAIHHADGVAVVTVNQRIEPKHDRLFTSLGAYRFEARRPAVVVLGGAAANGHVIADAVQFLPE